MAPPPTPPRRSAPRVRTPRPLRFLTAALRGVFVATPRHMFRWFVGAPPLLQVLVAAIGLSALGLLGYFGIYYQQRARRDAGVKAGWVKYGTALQEGREDGMRAALQEIVAASPKDALGNGRLAALDSGSADPADADMARYTMGRHFAAGSADKGRFQDADREAAKVHAVFPDDWQAHLIRGVAALARGDAAAAAGFAEKMDPGATPRADVRLFNLPLAFELFRAVGRSPAALRAAIQNRIGPILQSTAAGGAPAAVKATLVEAYLLGFEPAVDRPQPSPLVGAWAAAAKVSDAAADEAAAAGDVPTLARVGYQADRLAAMLDLLRKHEQVRDDQAAPLAADIDARARKVWEAVLDRNPKAGEAYRGLFHAHARSKDAPAALAALARGVEALPDDLDLRAMVSRLQQANGRAVQSYHDNARTAARFPEQPLWWRLAAEAALAANERGLALEACQHLLAARPDDKWALGTRGALFLDAGDPFQAAAALEKVGADDLARNPPAARAYARALTESGGEVRVADFVAKAAAATEQANSPAFHAAALRGWMEASPGDAPAAAARRAEAAADQADALARGKWVDAVDVLRLAADARSRFAELADPPWEPVRTEQAVQAYERIRDKLPADKEAATELGWLTLFKLNSPERARALTAPLQTADAEPTLTFRQVEVVGAVYRLTGRPEDAVRLLERAAGANAPAGVHVQLALAYLARGDRDAARARLTVAQGLPRTPHEAATYAAAAAALNKP